MMQEPTNLLFAQECEEYEGEYVPNVFCPFPKCGRQIRIPRDTYRWYDGPIPCRHCHSTFHVSIGDWDTMTQTLGGPVAKTVPFGNSQGGNLLEPPNLISEPDMVPEAMTEGIGENVPVSIREAFQTAINSLNDGDYGIAAERCRFTLEAALLERCVSARGVGLRNMADLAETQGIISETEKLICLIVARRGGDGAHPQISPLRQVSLSDALTLIGDTATVLRVLYPDSAPS